MSGMTIWVMRDGRLIIKAEHLRKGQVTVDFPVPHVSRIESYESPITGETISSWRQRDADMQAGGAVDPRDLPREPFERKKQNAKVLTDVDDTFRWDDA